MVVDNGQKASLFSEAWRALKECLPVFWPWILGASVGVALVSFAQHSFLQQHMPDPALMKQYQENPALFQQNPEAARQMVANVMGNLGYISLFATLTLFIQSIFYYIFSVLYLRLNMKNPPAFGVGEYFYWLGKVCWKYTRPILWMLLPLIGPFFYARSIVRYMLVTPLALLHHQPELQKSWDMTEGNWWRIFGNQLGLVAICLFIWMVIMIPFAIILLVPLHGDTTSPIVEGGFAIMQGLAASIMIVVGAVYACTAYRVLQREQEHV